MRFLRNVLSIAFACVLANALVVPAVMAETAEFPIDPVANQGKKWRLAYYEGGPYFEYRDVLLATLRGLMKFGWIETTSLPQPAGEGTDEIWRYVSEEVESDFIEFVPDAHYSSNWDEDGDREQVASSLIKRLNKNHDIDLVIAMGTWAGKDLANSKHDTPTVVFAASDPVAAGIIKSVDDSGLEHIHAAFDPGVYDRQIRIFHEMTKFNRLGLAYENSADGRSYAAVDVIESAGRDLGFDIVPCYTLSDIPDLDAAGDSVITCFQKLAQEVDAIYVTMQGGVRTESIPRLVRTANENRIPTFSQAGSEEVKYGFLASISQGNFAFVGDFNARTISRILNGAYPRQLEQRFEPPPKIAINLKTAEIIDYNPPIILLGAADEIYNEISAPGQ